MRWSFLLIFGTVAACTDPDSGTDGPSDTDDSGTETETDTELDLTSAKRLGAPEEYWYIWNTTEGCDTPNGPGAAVYFHTDDAKSVLNDDGTYSLTATETWYWFNGGNSPFDCKDVWQVTGTSTTTFGDGQCVTCEEFYSFTLTLESDGCHIPYHRVFGFSEGSIPPAPQVYTGFFAFDTHGTMDGLPNPDNRMLINARFNTDDKQRQTEHANPAWTHRFVDDPSVVGPPGGYEWADYACLPPDGIGS